MRSDYIYVEAFCDPRDVKVDVWTAGVPGVNGQVAVRLTHLPSGRIAEAKGTRCFAVEQEARRKLAALLAANHLR